MKEKAGAILTILLLGGLVFGLSIADFCSPDRLFSEYENRILAAKPEFDLEKLFAGTYTEEYETYVTDQFVGRNGWISIKTATDLLLGKKEVNGVYLAKDGTLIEKHTEAEMKPETLAKRLELVSKLTEWWEDRETGEGRLRLMLVPTADNILSDRLPDHAEYFLQQPFVEQIAATVGDNYVINLTDRMNDHKEEYIYYGTDHHWTTLGAYYGYLEWAENMGVTPVSYNAERVSDSFLGTLHSKTNLQVEPDVIEAPITGGVRVYYDFSEDAGTSLYEEKYLDTKNQYGYFLDDNHSFVRIEVEDPSMEAKGRKLFLIKDSYANCFVPFLTAHYETIYVLDLRYYRASLFSLMEECGADGGMDVLVLYNVVHFVKEFQYY